ncbi:cation-translocating P-type ATPase [Lapidilactobacillus wuchangensis]|uniref:cation-translocating P-type ATPase n=1 Tax=Lapidilactobacillus wuchangensis TaxID=2486001 RepID=UPI000F7B5BFB|nr:cation-transporting P-type ATPase [Lapidilactobacillus wuchangensis]
MTDSKMTTDQFAKLPLDQFYQTLTTSETGLTDDVAAQRLKVVGANTIQQAHKQSQFKVFIKNFISLMAILLWVSGVIAMIAGMPELGIAIWAVNVINGCFSYWQEHAAQKATDSLKKMLPNYTQVLRNGTAKQIDSTELVPGDVFLIQAGNSISADARIVTGNALQVDESALTGESVVVDKLPNYDKGDGQFSEQNVVYAGTMAVNGTATAVAINTGMQSEFGQIAALTEHQKTNVTPLTAELNRLTRQISLIAIIIGLLFFFAAIFFVHYPVAKSFVFGLGLIVAFIPEGLLPTVTLSLAQGVTRMSKKHALVKELSSVETLGETTVICSDKTGTLTQNQMTINHVWLPGQEYTVSGEGYVNNGQIQKNNQPVVLANVPDLSLLIRVAALNNDTDIQSEDSPRPKIVGTPTEAAHLVLAQKSGLDLKQLQQDYPRIQELPFDSSRKRMTTIHTQPNQAEPVIYVKGALVGILAQSDRLLENGQVRPITDADKKTILAANEGYATQGLRSMAIAYRDLDGQNGLPSKAADCTIDNTEQHLIFVGLTIMADPPRPEIYDAIDKCHRANIRVIMVTGDSPLTAKSVAVKIGIDSENVRVITGDELSQMSDHELQKAVRGEVIFARVAPDQKYRIVKANQHNGEIVASTGDGVNDAPALKQADIGIAMGLTGTDVAKDAADIILTDDNFASIVAAIEEGRTVYSNIQKFLLYILNSNVPEAIPSILFLFSRGLIPLPLTVMQILTIDLGTDMLPALGLGAEKSEPGIMDQPPRDRDAHLLNKSVVWKAFAWYGLLESIVSVAAYFFINSRYGWPQTALAASGNVYMLATTMTLASIVFCQIAMANNCRTQVTSVFKIGLFSNHRIWFGIAAEILIVALLMYVPFLQSVFNTTGLALSDWALLFCIPIPLFLLEEGRKAIVRWRMKRQQQPVSLK